MFHINGVLEFYITNECNLTCSNCNRYNNYNFTGHYFWRDQVADIKLWGQRLSVDLITVIGGEPTMHPELDEWINGLCNVWPGTSIMIQTNGTISKVKKYNYNHNVGYGVAIHSQAMTKKLSEKWQDHGVFDATEFTDCALKDQGATFTVHNSDPLMAFKACSMSKSHTILNGRLYKCPMVAILPEFRKQYNVTLTEDQENLLTSYKSLSADCTDQELAEFLNSRDAPIEQCRLCPEQHVISTVTFDPRRKTRPKK